MFSNFLDGETKAFAKQTLTHQCLQAILRGPRREAQAATWRKK